MCLVPRKSQVLDSLCSGVAKEAEGLSGDIQAIEERLRFFQEMQAIGPALDAVIILACQSELRRTDPKGTDGA